MKTKKQTIQIIFFLLVINLLFISCDSNDNSEEQQALGSEYITWTTLGENFTASDNIYIEITDNSFQITDENAPYFNLEFKNGISEGFIFNEIDAVFEDTFLGYEISEDLDLAFSTMLVEILEITDTHIKGIFQGSNAKNIDYSTSPYNVTSSIAVISNGKFRVRR